MGLNDDVTWLKEQVDLSQANPARVYDYWLGGAANFAIDRELGEDIAVAEPGIVTMAAENRSFLQRVVTYLSTLGIDQFLDLGSGIPTVGNVHEIAHRHNPQARVAYVDNEPVAVAHSHALLTTSAAPQTSITQADLWHPNIVLSAPGVAELLDFNRPIAVLALAVLQYFPDTDALVDLLATYRSHLASGSYLAISHPTADEGSESGMDVAAIAEGTRSPISSHQAHLRDHNQMRRLFTGTVLADPGIVPAHRWRNDEPTTLAASGCYAGLGRLSD